MSAAPHVVLPPPPPPPPPLLLLLRHFFCLLCLAALTPLLSVDCHSGGRLDNSAHGYGHRVKRQLATSTNVVELLAVVDRQAYNKYLLRNANNSAAAVTEITRYVAGLVKEANERLATIDAEGFSVRINLTSIIVHTTTAESSATENARINGSTTINGNAALLAFTPQANALLATFPHDYAVFITGFNIVRPDNTMVDVRTYFRGVCGTLRQGLVHNSCVERPARGLARALALSLGANIDGSGNNCTDDYFVQAPQFSIPPRSARVRPFTFSTCSATAIRTYLTTAFTTCLRSLSANTAVDVGALTATELGQTYNADQQCVLRFGTGSHLCRDLYGVSSNLTYMEDLCYNMRCLLPGTSSCQGILPFDGTSCANQRWCQDGLCVADAAAPAAPSATCPQGNQPGASCQGALCAVGGDLYRDYICCATCANLTTPTTATPNVTLSIPGTTAAPPVTPGTVSLNQPTTAAPSPINRTLSLVNNGNVATTASPQGNVTLSIPGVTAAPTAPPAPGSNATLSIAGATNAPPNVTTANPAATLSIAGQTAATTAPQPTLSLVGSANNTAPNNTGATLSVAGAVTAATSGPTLSVADAARTAGVTVSVAAAATAATTAGVVVGDPGP